MPYEADWPIYAGDTDYSGRIYTPGVIDYTIRTLEQCRRDMGYPEERMADLGLSQPARQVEMEYLGAIRIGDVLSVALSPSLGDSSVTFDVTCTVAGTLVAKGNFTAVYIDTATEDPVSIPPEIREELARLSSDSDGA